MLVLIVDTNLFHEFRQIEELPWEDLGEPNEIFLIITDPVQTELDKQKKSSSARLKRRALRWTKAFRQLILADQTDIIVKKARPRVIVRLDGTRPDTNHDDLLDRSDPDDCIVAVALALRQKYTDAKLAVFSDDLRPLRKARQLSMGAMQIPDNWRREAEQTDDEKARAHLEQQVEQLRRQEPELHLSVSPEESITHELPSYEALSDDQVDKLIDAVQKHNPMETDFEKAKQPKALGQLQRTLSSVEIIASYLERREFQPAPEENITRYIEKEYPEWLERCRERLAHAHEILGNTECNIYMTVELANKGTRPALDLQVTFGVNGPIGILPGDESKETEFIKHFDIPFSLPNEPDAPQGTWETYSPLGYLSRSNTQWVNDSAIYRTPTLKDILRDQYRDPNQFYYRDRPSEPTSEYSITCAQFRHADKVVGFDIIIRPSGDAQALDGKNAMVEVICNASNLTAPVALKIPLRFRCIHRSTYDAVLKVLG